MTYKTSINCEKANLKKIRSFVSNVLDQYGIPDKDINLLVVAVDEVCSNLIIHSHKCDRSKNIEVRIKKKNGAFTFEIIDSEELYDINQHNAPTIEQIVESKRMGGIGLILVKRIMDQIQVEKRGNMNICRLVKKFTAPL